jgi:NAD-dependent dihydropyrimidine dehydrogenase PreA subunit
MIESLSIEERKQFVDSCPKGVYALNDRTGAVEIENLNKCMFCDECVRHAEAIVMQTYPGQKYLNTSDNFVRVT